MSSPAHLPPHVAIASDHLAGMREIVASYPMLSSVLRIYRVRLVLDANVIVSDLLWLSRRKNPYARTRLQEIIAAGTVTAFAPPLLETEVLRHIPRVAQEENVEVERLEAEWETYRSLIRFHTPSEGELPAVVSDVDDLPYLYLRAELDAEAVYTHDPHLKAMGAPVIGTDIIVALQDYSRAASVEVTIKVGGMIVGVVGVVSARAIWVLLQQFVAALVHLPRSLKLIVSAAVLAVLVHPGGRAMLQHFASLIPKPAQACLKILGPLVGEAVRKAERANREAQAALDRVKPALRTSESQPLRVYALRVCVAEQRPLHVDEMAGLILKDGYITRARNFPGYLVRVLASRAEFTRCANGAWSTAA